jgi:hypothetical protein
VLSAYVRGCGGTTEEWEERWRSLTSAPTLPLLGARPTGCSTAASAGARIGSISPIADTPDPSVILAALDRVAEEMAVAPPAPLPARSGVSTIEQRPAIPVSTPAPTAAESPSGKAGTATASAWETTTMRTAWSSATGPLAREAGEPTAAGATTTTTAAGAAAAAAEGVGTAAGRPGTAGYSAATLGKPESGGSAGGMGSGGANGSGHSAATKPASAAGAASTMATAASGPTTVGRRSRRLSRTTVAALIAIAVCMLVALLAILA